MPRRRLAVIVLGLVFLCGSLWFWFQSRPWARAQRALDRGEAAEAVEITTEALAELSWPPSREESLREILVESHLKLGGLENAEKECRLLHQKFPRNPAGALGLGILNLAFDRLSFSAEYLEEARRLSPRDFRPIFILANVRLAQNDFPRTAALVEEGLKIFPNRPELLELSGDLAFDQGLFQKALARYGTVLRAAPGDRDTFFKITRAHLAAGDAEAAEASIRRLRRNPEDPEADLLLVGVRAQEGRRGEAESLCARVYQGDHNRFQAGFSLAYWLGLRGEEERAEAILSEINRRLPPLRSNADWNDPQDWDSVSRNFRGRLYARSVQRDYEMARAQLDLHAHRAVDAGIHARRALDLDSTDAGVLLLLADIARRRGDSKDRLRWIDRTVELYREHPGALLARGWAYLDMGRVSDAVVDAKLVSDAYPRLASAQALLSRAYLLIGRSDEASVVAGQAVALNGGDVDAQLALGLSRAASQNAAGAEKCFLKALEIDPFSAEARADYAWFLKRQNRLTEAKKQWLEASHLEPNVFPPLGLPKIKR